MFPHSTVLFCHLSRTRYFIFIGSRFNLCRSAPVTLRGVGSTLRGVVPYGAESSRRPIRFKAIVFYAKLMYFKHNA